MLINIDTKREAIIMLDSCVDEGYNMTKCNNGRLRLQENTEFMIALHKLLAVFCSGPFGTNSTAEMIRNSGGRGMQVQTRGRPLYTRYVNTFIGSPECLIIH